MIFLAIVLLFVLGGCSLPPLLGGGGGGSDEPASPPQDMGSKLIDVLPDLANSGAYLLSTFVYTAVVVALVFPAARLAAVGVFVAFYDRIASWFRPKYGKGTYVDPKRTVPEPDEPDEGDPPRTGD